MKEKKFNTLLYTSQGRESNFLAHLLVSFSFFLFVIVSTSCKNDSVTDVESITGFYEATTFVEPGQHDGGVDILANGGALTALLTSSFEAEGRFRIPENIGSNYPQMDTNYTGAFNVDGDTVRFRDTGTVLDNAPFVFIVNATGLETIDWAGHWASFKIIMDKQ